MPVHYSDLTEAFISTTRLDERARRQGPLRQSVKQLSRSWLFIDENLSPRMALDLCRDGHVAEHPLHYGELGMTDWAVVRRAIERNLVIVTTNARDFTKLLALEDFHPGLIALPDGPRDEVELLLRNALDWLTHHGGPMYVMVDKVLIVPKNGQMELKSLPDRPGGG